MCSNLKLETGEYVSVISEKDDQRYECKIERVDEANGKLFMHWHGYASKLDFWLEKGSDRIGPLKDANVPPPGPAKSRKQFTQAYDTENNELEASFASAADASDQCSSCKGQLHDVFLICEHCPNRVHLDCSELPEYILVRFLSTELGYTCRSCGKKKLSPQDMKKWQEQVSRTLQSERAMPNEAAHELENSSLVEKSVTDKTSNKKNGDIADKEKNAEKPDLKICDKYRRGSCPHGISGKKVFNEKKCKFDHPNICFKYRRAGNDKRYGCKRGNDCKWFHPLLCRSANSQNKVCPKEACTFLHVRGTRREGTRSRALPHSNVQPTPPLTCEGGGRIQGRSTQQGSTAPINTKRTVDLERSAKSASTPSKNDQLERIEQMILSMKTAYDQELKDLRQELVQSRNSPMPWMGPYYPRMCPPQGGLTPASAQPQVPMSYSHSLQRSLL